MSNTQPPKQSYIPPEVLALMELGRQKKLWSVQVVYMVKNETKLQIKRNLTDEELVKFREALFRYGMQIPIGPGHWKIIPPYDIHEVDLHRQEYFIMDEPYKTIK